MPVVRGVDRVFVAVGLDRHGRVQRREGAGARVEDEAGGRTADREHDQRLRPVDHEAGPELVGARLLEMRRGVARAGERRQDREDGADGDVGLDVGRTVERVDRHDQRLALVQHLGDVELLRDQHGHGGTLQRLSEEPVGQEVERLLHVATGVLVTALRHRRGAQRPERDLPGGLDGGTRHGSDHRGHRRQRRISRDGSIEEAAEPVRRCHSLQIQHAHVPPVAVPPMAQSS